jgi:hypothetical protein
VTGRDVIQKEKIIVVVVALYQGFCSSHESVERITRRIFEKEEEAPTTEELDAVTLILIWAAYKLKHNGILVTENPKLLENRLSFERRDTEQLLNIVNVSEALEIMDIFAKSKGFYLIKGPQGVNNGLWYFVSFRSKVPHYHVLSSETLDAFSMRFTQLLRSIDEMGLQYYSELAVILWMICSITSTISFLSRQASLTIWQ